jgi:hypothetical protein
MPRGFRILGYVHPSSLLFFYAGGRRSPSGCPQARDSGEALCSPIFSGAWRHCGPSFPMAAEWASIFRSFAGLSAQIIPVNTPAYVYSSRAANAAKHEPSHESNFVSDPPSNPTYNCHANNDTELVHINGYPAAMTALPGPTEQYLFLNPAAIAGMFAILSLKNGHPPIHSHSAIIHLLLSFCRQ